MALAWALDTESVYVAKQRSIQVAMQLYTRFRRVKVNALLDCGATENFIYPRLVKQMKLATKPLKRPQQVKNVDGTPNKAGTLKYYTDIITRTGTKCIYLCYTLTDLGDN